MDYAKWEITHNHQTLAYIFTPYSDGTDPVGTNFLTPPESPMQIGLIGSGKIGRTIEAHKHVGKRRVVGCPETLLVIAGRIEVTVYTESGAFVSAHYLNAGAMIVLVSGGHRVRLDSDSQILEIKQGPYLLNDKVAL